MLTFNMLLRGATVDPEKTRLIRHVTKDRDLFNAWLTDRQEFELYQSSQRWRYRFLVGGHVASFVVDPHRDTLFVGLYQVSALMQARGDERAALGVAVNPGDAIHEMTLSPTLSGYIGRLTVDWGSSAITYIQHAHRQDKEVLELRRAFSEPNFPGFRDFVHRVGDLPMLYPAWQQVLKASRGVYLLTSPEGEHYVGAAYGSNGLWGRIVGYADSDQGNLGLRGKKLADFQVTILDTVPESADMDAVLSLESKWKEKLGSRVHGLNHV